MRGSSRTRISHGSDRGMKTRRVPSAFLPPQGVAQHRRGLQLDRAFVRSESATLGPADAARTEVDDDEVHILSAHNRSAGPHDAAGLGDLVAQALARQLMMEEEQAFQLRLQQMAGPGLRSSPQDCGIQPTKDPLPGCGTEWLRGQVSCMPMRPTASRRVTASRLTSKTRES